VLATGPPPSIQTKRSQSWEKIADPAERRLAVVRLHAEGWKVASIAEYLATSRQTVYTTLKRWVEEGVRELEDKSRARKAPRVVTLDIANEIRKKQENPLISLRALAIYEALDIRKERIDPRQSWQITLRRISG